MINKWKFFIHRVHVNFEREAYREKEGERSSEFTWNLWTKKFHLLTKFYKTWMKKYGHFFETLPSCIFWIKIISFEIIAIFHRTVGDEPGILLLHVTSFLPLSNLFKSMFPLIWMNILLCEMLLFMCGSFNVHICMCLLHSWNAN